MKAIMVNETDGIGYQHMTGFNRVKEKKLGGNAMSHYWDTVLGEIMDKLGGEGTSGGCDIFIGIVTPGINRAVQNGGLSISQEVIGEGTKYEHIETWITVEGKLINESNSGFSGVQMEEYAGTINQSIMDAFGIEMGGMNTLFVYSNITVETDANPLTATDYTFILRDPGKIPDMQRPGQFRPRTTISSQPSVPSAS